MSSQYYVGTVLAVAEVDTFTPASVTTGDVNTLTVKNEYAVTITTVSFTVGGTQTAAAVVTGLTAAWNANGIASPLATASGSATFILTAVPAGQPLHVTSAVTGTGTLSKATTIASAGPSDWNQSGNWSLGTVPVSSDSVYLDPRMQAAVLYGLNQSAVTLTNLYADLGCLNVGQMGVPLQISATNLVVGRNLNGVNAVNSAGNINIDLGTNASTGVVLNSNPTPSFVGLETVRVKGTNASNSISIVGGLVGIATSLPGDTATYPTITCSGGILNVSSGVTSTTVVNDGGQVTLSCAATTATNSGTGTLTTRGLGLIGTANSYGTGNLFVGNRPTAGTAITTLNTLSGSTTDFTVDSRATTVGTMAYGGGTINVLAGTQVTFSTTTLAFNNNGTLAGKFTP
jgi:hypothetical protein